MTPEVHILGLNILFFAIAYLAVYPRLERKTLRNMTMVDLVLIVVLLGIAGSVYFGTGTRFSLIFFDVNWWIFTLVVAFIVEVPLFLWFCRKWGVDLNNWDGD